MNPEVNQPKDKSKRIGYLFVALSLVLNIVMLFLISGTRGELAGARGELDRHNKILITLPPDLQNEISATFKQTAGEIKSEALKTTKNTSAQIIADAEKKNADALGKIDKQMTTIITAQNQLRPELAKLNGNIDSVVQADKRNHLNAEMAIDNEAFFGCTGLTDLVISNGVNAIGNNAFGGCTNLKSIVIPESVKFLGLGAFAECAELARVEIRGGGITTLGEDVFYRCVKLTEIVIPESITEIEKRAFYGCRSLTNVNIPTGVKELYDEAFAGCTAMTNVTMAKKTKYGKTVFKDCPNLKDIVKI